MKVAARGIESSARISAFTIEVMREARAALIGAITPPLLRFSTDCVGAPAADEGVALASSHGVRRARTDSLGNRLGSEQSVEARVLTRWMIFVVGKNEAAPMTATRRVFNQKTGSCE